MAAWPEQTLQFAYVAVSLALAAALLHLDVRNRAARAFAALLVFRAAAGGAYAMGLVAADPVSAYVWWSVFPYFVIPLSVLPLLFLAAYSSAPLARRHRRAIVATLVATVLALEALYLADHALFWYLGSGAASAGGPALTAPAGPLFVLYALFEAIYALVGLALAREWARLPPGPRAVTTSRSSSAHERGACRTGMGRLQAADQAAVHTIGSLRANAVPYASGRTRLSKRGGYDALANASHSSRACSGAAGT